MRQRAVAQFGRAAQVTQRLRPVTFGEVALALFLGHLRTTTAVEARPGIDHPPGYAEQPQHQTHHQIDQPEQRQQGKESPQAGFVAEALVGDQHIAGLFGDGQADQRRRQDDRQDQQVDPAHGWLSVSVAAGAAGCSCGCSCSCCAAAESRRAR
ncbi:hypothetical protein D9M70_551440 [compost metagenome]